MRKYVIKRILQLILILFGVTFLVFGLMYISPGDPAQKKLTAGGIAVSEDVLEETREEMGLNRPFLVQYGDWLGKALRGDLGTSFKDGIPVGEKLLKGIKYTAILSVSSFLLAVLVSIPLGIYSAVRQNRFGDYLIRFLSFIGNSLPNFLISVLLMYFFCIKFKIFPIIAEQSLKGLFLPALTLAVPMMSQFIRQIRAEVLEQLHQPYVSGARARGVKERFILFGNVLHNSMIPIVTVLGLSVGSLMAGSVVVETIFMWPGLGKLAMDSITARDYPVVQGFVILMAVIYVLVNLITDLSYHRLDPRVNEEWEEE
ncbi:ABC transporter permease [Wansuia hejianensis]|uniref:Nickel import system permease protein NikB n=1 Tax=Wansuia hejianensis TaxID=2763667 RepID=A0A7G9GC23_9FIRM|nr:nickel ABC transporter permease [Wansuia hejianensis]QNM08355.1 ABC transporter permease [Wansuia hejianensis]